MNHARRADCEVEIACRSDRRSLRVNFTTATAFRGAWDEVKKRDIAFILPVMQ